MNHAVKINIINQLQFCAHAKCHVIDFINCILNIFYAIYTKYEMLQKSKWFNAFVEIEQASNYKQSTILH